jgi:hypothetical protein
VLDIIQDLAELLPATFTQDEVPAGLTIELASMTAGDGRQISVMQWAESSEDEVS